MAAGMCHQSHSPNIDIEKRASEFPSRIFLCPVVTALEVRRGERWTATEEGLPGDRMLH